jgi:Tol biopolymer transport system component
MATAPRIARLSGCAFLVAMTGSAAIAAPGENELASVKYFHPSAAGNGMGAVSLSPDGRFVAFDSEATTLVRGDTNAVGDVFLYDRQLQLVRRVSVGSGGRQANGASAWPQVTRGGRYVVFHSAAGNLVPGDTNGVEDVFVRDRWTGTTERVSVGADGGQLSGASLWPSISDDGRVVVFYHQGQLRLRDRQLGTTTIVSVNDAGTQGNRATLFGTVSGNGGHVVFESLATNLVPGDTNDAMDVFVRDRVTDTTQRVSVGPGRTQLGAYSYQSAISSGGRWVTFMSDADPVGVGPTLWGQLYRHDRSSGETVLVSADPAGRPANGQVIQSRLSPDGRYVAFESEATNLIAGDTNGVQDIFLRDMASGTTARVSVAANGAQGNGASWFPRLSDDGRFVAFATLARNLVVNDGNRTVDVYVHETGGPSAGPETTSYKLRPNALEFGEVAVGSGRKIGFNLLNTSNVPLPVTAVQMLGADARDFVVENGCRSPVPVSAECRIGVTFRPQSTGTKQAYLRVVAGGIARNRAVTGTGL